MSSNSTAVATISEYDRIKNTLNAVQMQDSLRKRLPPGVSLDRFTATAITAVGQNPDLIDCDRNSLYNAIASCAKDGLLPDGKQAAIVAFNTKVKWRDAGGQWQEDYIKKAQHMPMVEGIIHVFGKHGVKAYAISVYANDEFEIWNDENGQHLRHRPVGLGKTRGERVGAVAVAKDKDGQVWVEAMDMTDLEVPKRATKQKDNQGNLIGPWRDVPDRMEQKSALHRLAKRVPKVDLQDDDEFQDQESAPPMTTAAGNRGMPQQTPEPAQKNTSKKARSAALQAVVDAGGAEAVPSAAPTEAQPEKAETKSAAAETKLPPTETKSEPKKAEIQQSGREVF